jgi:hypothetical protein
MDTEQILNLFYACCYLYVAGLILPFEPYRSILQVIALIGICLFFYWFLIGLYILALFFVIVPLIQYHKT